MRKILFSLVIFILGCTLFALDISANVYGGIATPFGTYAGKSVRDIGSGYAEMGFMISGEVDVNIKGSDFFWSTSLTAMNNPYDSTHLDAYYENILSIDPEHEEYELDISVDNWFNTPLLTGIKIKKDFFDNVVFFGSAQAGFNLCKSPDQEVKFRVYGWENDHLYENKTTLTQKADLTSNMAMVLSGGLVIFDRFNLGVKMYNLGFPKIKAKQELEQKYYEDGIYYADNTANATVTIDKIPVRVFSVSVGVTF